MTQVVYREEVELGMSLGRRQVPWSVLEAVPKCVNGLATQLRQDLGWVWEEYEETYGEKPSDAIPHPNTLSDAQVVLRWCAATDETEDPVYGDPDLLDSGFEVFAEVCTRAYPGVLVGCGALVAETAVPQTSTMKERRVLLRQAVPAWSAFLEAVGPALTTEVAEFTSDAFPAE